MKTVLITGATSGIGLELAKLFARDNYTLVIISRNAAHLDSTALLLRSEGATDVITIPKDLSLPNAAEEIYTDLKEKYMVDVLVNNAGIGEYGSFSETSLDREIQIVHLNIIALIHLTKLFLRDMLANTSGKILQVASVSAYEPSPKLAVYAASKAFVLSFSDAIGTELKDTGVTITTLIPSATDTDFFHKAGMEHTKAAQENPEDPSVVAKIGYEALMKGESHALAPGVRQQIFMSSLLSNRSVAKMVGKQMGEDEHKEN